MFTKSFLPCLSATLCCASLFLASCNAPQSQDSSHAIVDSAKVSTTAVATDSVVYIPETERATKLSKLYKFVEDESFDRCNAAKMQYKDGKAVDLPADVVKYLSCYDHLDLRNDRYLVYDTEQSYFLYDLEKKVKFKVFDKAKDVYYYSMRWSPNGKKQLFMGVQYDAKSESKKTKLMVFEYNDDFTAIVSKKKMDTKVCYIEVEGPPAFDKESDLAFVDDNTLQVNQAVCDTASFGNIPRNMVKIDLKTVK